MGFVQHWLYRMPLLIFVVCNFNVLTPCLQILACSSVGLVFIFFVPFCSYTIWATLEARTSAAGEEIDVAKRDGMASLCE